MKYLLPLLLILISCSPSEKSVSSNEKLVQNNSPSNMNNPESIEQKEKINNEGIYELFLGVHNIEYFADRMVLKSKRAGYDFAQKRAIGLREGKMHYQVVLGPFNSKEEAQIAEGKIKSLTPDLTISRIVKK